MLPRFGAKFEFTEYLADNNPYFGAVVGRVANRIAGARFSLNGKNYELSANRPPNHLHGGNRGFDKVIILNFFLLINLFFFKVIWNSSIQGDKLVLTYLSVDGEEGYPGDVLVTAIYSLSADNKLTLEMKAVATKPTPVNLTNHSYFNLAGEEKLTKEGLYEHLLSINADRYTVTDGNSIPTGELAPVGGTLWDLRIPRQLGDVIPLMSGGGYDHNFCITSNEGLTFVARVVHPQSARTLEVYSNQPGVQFYTSNYFPKDTSNDPPGQLNGKFKIPKTKQTIFFLVVQKPLIGRRGRQYFTHAAFCLETQNFPDAINHVIHFLKIITF